MRAHRVLFSSSIERQSSSTGTVLDSKMAGSDSSEVGTSNGLVRMCQRCWKLVCAGSFVALISSSSPSVGTFILSFSFLTSLLEHATARTVDLLTVSLVSISLPDGERDVRVAGVAVLLRVAYPVSRMPSCDSLSQSCVRGVGRCEGFSAGSYPHYVTVMLMSGREARTIQANALHPRLTLPFVTCPRDHINDTSMERTNALWMTLAER